MTNPITFKTIHDSFTSIIKNTKLTRQKKIELFVDGIAPSVTLNDKLKDKIETCLYHLNAQNNRADKDKHTKSELSKIYFPNLRTQENIEAEASVANTQLIEERSSIEIEHPIGSNNSIDPDEIVIKADVSFTDDDGIAPYLEANKNNDNIPTPSASANLATPYTDEFGDITQQVNQIFNESQMTHNDLTEELTGLLLYIYEYIQLFPHKKIKTLPDTGIYHLTKPIDRIINVQKWNKSLMSYSTNIFKNKEDLKGIIFIINVSKLLFEGSSHQRELMLLLYFSIITQPITIQKVVHSTEIESYHTELFKEHYPALYSDIISDIRFEEIINMYEKLFNLKYSGYPDDEYHTAFNSFSIIPTLCIVAGLILAFVNILPMITTIGILGSSLFILNIKRNYDINNDFKKTFSMLENTSQTTKTFRTNLILTSLLVIATTLVFVSLVLNSYPMIALLTGAFCMTVSLTLNEIFCESSYAKLSKSLIENHKEKIEQDKLEHTKLINDFVESPNQSSSSKTSADLRPAIQVNNNLALVGDKSLFGGSQQTGHPPSNASFGSHN